MSDNIKTPVAETKKCDSWFLNDEEQVVKCCEDLNHTGDHKGYHRNSLVVWDYAGELKIAV